MKKIVLFILIMFLFVACDSKENTETQETEVPVEVVQTETPSEEMILQEDSDVESDTLIIIE